MLQLAHKQTSNDSQRTKLKSHFSTTFIWKEVQLHCYKMLQPEPEAGALASPRDQVFFVAFQSKQVHSETLSLQKKLGARIEQVKSVITRRLRTAPLQDLLLE